MRASVDPEDWPEAMATVLSCRYTARVGRAIAFGLPSSKHFLIAFNYWANGILHTGETYTEQPIPQGNLFRLQYDPADPQRVVLRDGAGAR